MTDDALREAFQDPTGSTLEGCDLDAVWAGAAGQLEEEARSRLLAHVRSCGACAEAWALAREAQAAARVDEDAVRVEVPPPANRSLAWVALLAAAVLLFVGLWALRPSPVDGDPDVFRGDGDAIEVLVEGAGRRLAWSEVPDAVQYEVTVLGADLTVLHEARTEKAELVVPAAAGSGPVLWRVTARRADGTALESETFSAVLSEAPE